MSQQAARANLVRILSLTTDALKTVNYYDRSLGKAVRSFYRGDIDSGTFIGEMIRLIEGQFRRAWNEGMRANGLNPATDMKPEWETILQAKIDNEFNHVLDFAQGIRDAAARGDPVDPYVARVSLWTNRYNDVVNLAKVTTGGDQKLEWQLGRTERHCSTCSALHGTVAWASQWQASGYRPQNAPNPMLECRGWRCDCRLEPTNKPLSPGGIPI